MQFRLRLRAQILLSLVALLALSLVLIFWVARGISRSAAVEQRLVTAQQKAWLVASMVGHLEWCEDIRPSDPGARRELGEIIRAHPEISRVLFLDENLNVLLPVDGVTFWSPEEAGRLLAMMDEDELAYRFPEGATSSPLWVLVPTAGFGGSGAVHAVALFFERGRPAETRLFAERMLLLMLGLIIAGVALLAHVILTRLVVTPLRRIVRTIDRVQGDVIPDPDPAHPGPPRGNEMEILNDAVLRMSARLEADKRHINDSIDRLRELNLKLVRAQEDLVSAEKQASVGRLASGVAHEIGNPLAVVLGYIDILRQEEVTAEERQEYLEDIAAATQRIHTIIRDLLEFSRPAREGEETADLRRAVESSLKLLRPQAKFARVTTEVVWELESDAGTDEPSVAVHINEGRLQQILVNLLVNAADALDGHGHIRLVVVCEVRRVRLSVIDNGPGISADEQRRIFDPFYTTKEPGKGTGLGLAICYSLISAYGGRLTVESSPGEGARFHIDLWRPEYSPDGSPPDSQPHSSGAGSLARGIEVRR